MPTYRRLRCSTKMNEQISITFWQRPDRSQGGSDYIELVTLPSHHVPRKGDVVILEDEVYIVHEVSWQIAEWRAGKPRITKVAIFMDYDGPV